LVDLFEENPSAFGLEGAYCRAANAMEKFIELIGDRATAIIQPF
jgi:predicted Ser/Thr protein kinase